MCACLASVEASWQVLHWAPTGGKLRGVARSSHRAELCECYVARALHGYHYRILLVNLLQSSRSTFSCEGFLSFFAFNEGMLGQTGPTDCLPQCGNNRLCWVGVTPSISAPSSPRLEASFCLYTALLLIESLYTGYSRLIPHQWKGCYGPVCVGHTNFSTWP